MRSIYAGRDLELFMVTAFATIFIVRAALAATGWPQLGGGKIHFAHLLWGGLGMLIAFVLFMAMQGRLWRVLATFAAGIGFGLFIDELGKFVTSDNDYFFQPAIAFIYLIFVVLFLIAHIIVRNAKLSPQSALVNAFDVAKEAVLRDLDQIERAKGLTLLAECDQSDPLVRDLNRMLTRMTSLTQGAPPFYERLRARFERFYDSLVRRRWFKGLLVGYLVVVALANILVAIAFAVAVAAGQTGLPTLDFWSLGQVISSLVSGAFVLVGLVRWRQSRLTAYRWFQRALLVTIFVTEFFAFYHNQNAQFLGLAVTLLTYAAITGMIRQEEVRAGSPPSDDAAVPAPQVEG